MLVLLHLATHEFRARYKINPSPVLILSLTPFVDQCVNSPPPLFFCLLYIFCWIYIKMMPVIRLHDGIAQYTQPFQPLHRYIYLLIAESGWLLCSFKFYCVHPVPCGSSMPTPRPRCTHSMSCRILRSWCCKRVHGTVLHHCSLKNCPEHLFFTSDHVVFGNLQL